jgi:hypothetical protein
VPPPETIATVVAAKAAAANGVCLASYVTSMTTARTLTLPTPAAVEKALELKRGLDANSARRSTNAVMQEAPCQNIEEVPEDRPRLFRLRRHHR